MSDLEDASKRLFVFHSRITLDWIRLHVIRLLERLNEHITYMYEMSDARTNDWNV